MGGEIRLRCECMRCGASREGYMFQTKQVRSKHMKQYGPLVGRAPVPIPRPRPALQPLYQNRSPHIPSDDEDDFLIGPNPDFPPRHLTPEPPPPPEPDRPELEHLPPRDIDFHPVQLPRIHGPGVDEDQGDRPTFVPRALSEKPQVRIAYLQAVTGNIYGNLTVDQATKQLNATLDALFVADALPILPRPVRHLVSAKRRLGIDPDQWITQYAICPNCWKHHTPAELELLASPSCSIPSCTGLIYSDHWDAKNK
jgi:hypothetical protein